MKSCLNNLRNLFSNDDKVMYQALLEKKDWILNPFYVIGTFQDNQDVIDILEGKLRFKKLYLDPEAFENKDDYERAFEKFNDSFRVLFLNETMPYVDDDSDFIICYNFRRLTDREYKVLFANFYPSLNDSERLEKEEDDTLYLLKQAMDNRLGDNSIIMGKESLVDSCFSCRVIDKIIIPQSLNDGYRVHLKLLCEKLKIAFEEV